MKRNKRNNGTGWLSIFRLSFPLSHPRLETLFTSSSKGTASELLLYCCSPGVNLSTAVILKSLHFREHSSPTSSPVPNMRHCTQALLASQVPIQLWKRNQEISTAMRRADHYCDRRTTAEQIVRYVSCRDLNLHQVLYSRGAALWYRPIPGE